MKYKNFELEFPEMAARNTKFFFRMFFSHVPFACGGVYVFLVYVFSYVLMTVWMYMPVLGYLFGVLTVMDVMGELWIYRVGDKWWWVLMFFPLIIIRIFLFAYFVFIVVSFRFPP